jgi:AAA domain
MNTPFSDAENRLRNCGHEIEIATDKLAAFADLVATFIPAINEGYLLRIDVADRFDELATAYGLYMEYGIDKVQAALADGLDREAQRLDQQRQKGSSKANGKATELISSRASDIVPEKVEWLWTGRLARGKHTCIAGEQGTGKSQLSIAIIAAITTGGSWPCGEGQSPIKGNVVILSAEDGAADTIAPRLEAAGADRSRVVIVSAVLDGNGRRTFNLQTDIEKLERKISEIGDVALVVIDPVSSYLGKTDSHKNSEVRGVLEPLAEMADRTRVAVLSITHFNKPGSANTVKALHRIIGSVAFSAAPRVAFAVIEDAENLGRYLVLHAKNNLAPAPQGLAYRLEQTIITNGIVASRVGWETEPVAMTANQAMAADATGGEHQKAVDEAEKLLRDILAEGPVTAKQIKVEADGACIAWRTIKRAKGKLGIISEKPDMASGWVWTLPEGGQQCRRVPTLKVGPLREIWPPSETAIETPSGRGEEVKL